jgi:hypothetical protein
MLPKPIEYEFEIDHEHYRLVEWDRGAERRIRADYALAIAAAPQVMQSMDGANLYAEAVARECLRDAPEIFWDTLPALAGHNGTTRRVVTLEHIPRALWELFREEVDRFLALIFPPLPTTVAAPSPAGPDDPVPVASAETVPPLFRGRAE